MGTTLTNSLSDCFEANAGLFMVRQAHHERPFGRLGMNG